MSFRVEWLRSAVRAFNDLPESTRGRLERAIDDLVEEPRPPGSRQLVGGSGERRVRVGDYRIVYWIDDSNQTIMILKVAHRRDVYR